MTADSQCCSSSASLNSRDSRSSMGMSRMMSEGSLSGIDSIDYGCGGGYEYGSSPTNTDNDDKLSFYSGKSERAFDMKLNGIGDMDIHEAKDHIRRPQHNNKLGATKTATQLTSQAVQMLERQKQQHAPQIAVEPASNTKLTSADSAVTSSHESNHTNNTNPSPRMPSITTTTIDDTTAHSNDNTEVGRNLSAYLPRCVLTKILSHRVFQRTYAPAEEHPPVPRQWPTRYGGILMIDVSGFTMLTVKLSKDHHDVVERPKRRVGLSAHGQHGRREQGCERCAGIEEQARRRYPRGRGDGAVLLRHRGEHKTVQVRGHWLGG